MQVYVEGPSTHAVQTAWAMLALMYAGQVWFLRHISLNFFQGHISLNYNKKNAHLVKISK
jgi:hypothetical protein